MYMPGDYESSDKDDLGITTIILGSVVLAAGIPLAIFPVTMPLGITFIAMGGSAVFGGGVMKATEKIANRKEKKMQQGDSKEPYEDFKRIPPHEVFSPDREPKKSKIVPFKSDKSHVRQFDHAAPKDEIIPEITNHHKTLRKY